MIDQILWLFFYILLVRYLCMHPVSGCKIEYDLRRRVLKRLLRYCGNDTNSKRPLLFWLWYQMICR